MQGFCLALHRSRAVAHRGLGLRYITQQLSETTAKKQDLEGRHNTKRACTILLFAKKMKFFYSLYHKHLAIFVNKKIGDFRIKRASLCKGWGDYVFLVGVKVNNRKQSKGDSYGVTKFQRSKGTEL